MSALPRRPPPQSEPPPQQSQPQSQSQSRQPSALPPPLLLVCALGIERRALRGGDLRGPAGAVALLRTGMGPQAAARSVAAALGRGAVPGDAAVLATGFCAGLAPGMRPGDIVVATEVRQLGGQGKGQGAADGVVCPSAHALASALRARLAEGARTRGARVHCGVLASADHVVRGAERSAVRAEGALAVDMESAATLMTAQAREHRRVAVARVVVDTPERELLRLSTLRNGMTAFRTLRYVIPALFDWHRTLAGMDPAGLRTTRSPRR